MQINHLRLATANLSGPGDKQRRAGPGFLPLSPAEILKCLI
jgi:hypothetical protein